LSWQESLLKLIDLFFGGGKEENDILTKWEKQIPNTHSLSGKLKLTEELQKISELN
jgi:hypothetical protein